MDGVRIMIDFTGWKYINVSTDGRESKSVKAPDVAD